MIGALLERRVPQYVGLYVVGGWGFIQFVDWVVEQYMLSPALTNLVVVLLLILLPGVVYLAWRFGAPGDNAWRPRDATLVGVNVVVAAAAVFLLFRDATLGRTAEVRLIENPDGEMVEHVVADPEFRRRILFFLPTNETGDPEFDWLVGAIAIGLSTDLAQDPYVSQSGSNDGYAAERLRGAGLDPMGNVPLALMRDVSRAQAMDYFVAWTIERSAEGGVVARMVLYDAETAKIVAERTYPMGDPREAADRMSVDLRRDMGIPDAHIASNPDLPVAEIVTTSPEAYRALAEAQTHRFRMDAAGAAEAAARAIALDSTAVMAHMAVGQAAMDQGDMEAFGSAFTRALGYDYRLPERLRLFLRAGAQMFVEPDLDAALRTASYWAEAFPGDPEAHLTLAQLHGRLGDEEARVRALRAAVAIDPSNLAPLRSLALEQLRSVSYDSAVSAYRELAALQPGNVEARFALAVALTSAGRLEEAREVYEEARTLDPRDADGARRLGLLELSAGNRGSAETLRAEAGTLARTTREHERLAGFDETLCYLAGQFDCLEAAYRERLRLISDPQLNSPVGVPHEIRHSEFLTLASEAGREDEARAQLDSLRNSVDDPGAHYGLYYSAGYLATLGRRDIDAARARGVLDTLRALAAELQRDDESHRWMQNWLEGHIAWQEDGNCRRALTHLEELLVLGPGGRYSRWALLRCYTELQRWDEAQEIADWYMEREPGWVPFRFDIARYYAARGQRDEALEHLAFVLGAWAEADPEYRPAQEARALRDRLARG